MAREGFDLLGSPMVDLNLYGDDPLDRERNFGSRSSLNDAGQIVFWAELADGREGIFLWSGPGPGTEPPRITSILLEDEDVVVRLPSVEGVSYQLRRLDRLASAGWIEVGSAVSGTGADIELRHSAGARDPEPYYVVTFAEP